MKTNTFYKIGWLVLIIVALLSISVFGSACSGCAKAYGCNGDDTCDKATDKSGEDSSVNAMYMINDGDWEDVVGRGISNLGYGTPTSHSKSNNDAGILSRKATINDVKQDDHDKWVNNLKKDSWIEKTGGSDGAITFEKDGQILETNYQDGTLTTNNYMENGSIIEAFDNEDD